MKIIELVLNSIVYRLVGVFLILMDLFVKEKCIEFEISLLYNFFFILSFLEEKEKEKEIFWIR